MHGIMIIAQRGVTSGAIDYGMDVTPSARLFESRFELLRCALRRSAIVFLSSGSLRKTADDFSQSRLSMAG